MNKLLILCVWCWSLGSFALSGPAYMERFDTYTKWYQQLPIVPNPEFLTFVQERTPLANKLRDKWLYELARLKDWPRYTHYYQPTTDMNLVCFNQIARYQLGYEQEVLKDSESIWLIGESRPQACNTMFDLLLKNEHFKQELITQRIWLALDKNNISLARYLLKHYKVPHPKEADTLVQINQKPTLITKLEPGEFSSLLYLYGLKKIAVLNMEQAIKVWHQPKTKKILSDADEQRFFVHIAWYKSMRGNEDTLVWFNKIKAQYYNEQLIDWQIRFALKKQRWHQVIALINQASNKKEPIWQYWLARSYDAIGNKEKAREIYTPLARNRHYYGFLASQRLQQKPHMENEATTTDLSRLSPYQPIIQQIYAFYTSKQYTQASRLLNDFVSELPKDEASALIYWVSTNLHWHGKSIYLSSNEQLNNQLQLRFPLPYQGFISNYSQNYAVPLEFIYAIIRQESSFREDVVSGVGARGLMQIMPSTASAVAKISQIPYAHQDQLFTSQKNIHIGTAYIQQLGKRFKNHPMLIAAAYNAGPRQVVNWVNSSSSKDMDIWIETLPWQETRNYLKNVMAFAIVYQYRLNKASNLRPFIAQL